jgi:hypothetical protein
MQAISSGRTPPLLGEGDDLNLLTFDPITRIKVKSWERPHSQTIPKLLLIFIVPRNSRAFIS